MAPLNAGTYPFVFGDTLMNHLLDTVMRQVIFFSCVPLGCAALIGFVVSLIEGVLQVQEQTTIYCMKLGVLIGLLWLFGPRVLQYLIKLHELSFTTLALIGQG